MIWLVNIEDHYVNFDELASHAPRAFAADGTSSYSKAQQITVKPFHTSLSNLLIYVLASSSVLKIAGTLITERDPSPSSLNS